LLVVAAGGRCKRRLKQGLAGLEHHLVVDWEKFVDEEPRAVGALLFTVTVCQQPFAIHVFNDAMQPAKLSVVEADIAARHAPNQHFLICRVHECLVRLGPVDKFELNRLIVYSAPASVRSILISRKVYRHM
jgi:hypothetical protein